MFEFEMKGFKEVQRKLQEIKRKAEILDGKHVTFAEVFSTDFLTKYTEFASLEDMFQASGFAVKSQEDLEKIPEDKWDSFIVTHTRFSSWKNMLETAVTEWVARKLGF